MSCPTTDCAPDKGLWVAIRMTFPWADLEEVDPDSFASEVMASFVIRVLSLLCTNAMKSLMNAGDFFKADCMEGEA